MSVRPLISYQDDYGLFPQLLEELSKRLPLTNVNYKTIHPLTGKETTRVVDVLEVDIRKYSHDIFPKNMAGLNVPLLPVTTGPPTTATTSTSIPSGATVTTTTTAATAAAASNTITGLPFLHLFLISCDDVDTYRSTVRKQITDWLNLISAKRNQEWLIVYVSSAEASKNPVKFLTSRSSVYDKIKADFNMKKDRCVNLKLFVSSSADADSWADFVNKIKDGLVTAFESQMETLMEDIKKSESQRSLPGWNYFQYFMLKEGMANYFEVFNMPDLAVLVYDELEETYVQQSQSPPAVWFKNFGALDKDDDSADPLNLKRKNYRELILSSEISVFDFMVYLYARRCQILFKLNKPDTICQKTRTFLTTMAELLKEHKSELTSYFYESFCYSISMCMVAHCEEHVAVSKIDEKSLVLFEGGKAELLGLARYQLDKLGLWFKLIVYSMHVSVGDDNGNENNDNYDQVSPALLLDSVTAPLSEQDLESVNTLREAFSKTTNAELKDAMGSKENFDALYLKITQRSIRCLEHCGTRSRTWTLLKGDVAFLYYLRGNFAETMGILSELCLRNASNGDLNVNSAQSQPQSQSQSQLTTTTFAWYIIDNWFLEILADCCLRLSQPIKYLNALLQLVNNWCCGFGVSRKRHFKNVLSPSVMNLASASTSNTTTTNEEMDLLHDEEKKVMKWIQELESIASKIDHPVTRDMEGMFSVTILSMVNKIGDEDAMTLEVEIRNSLPRGVTLDKVTVYLVGGADSQDLLFEASNVTLIPGSVKSPGKTKCRLTCEKVSLAATYVVEKVRLDLGQVSFMHNFLSSSKKMLFSIGESKGVVEMKLSIPDNVVYGEQNNFLSVKIRSRHYGIQEGLLTLTPVLTGLTLVTNKPITTRIISEFDPDAIAKERSMEMVDNHTKFVIPPCSPHDIIEFQVPFTLNSSSNGGNNVLEHQFKAVLSYTRNDGRKRVFSTLETIRLGLPFAMKHGVWSDVKGSFAQVEMMNLWNVPIRVMDVGLSGLQSSQWSVKPLLGVKEMLVFHNQSVSSAYRLLSSSQSLSTTKQETRLSFTIKFHTLSDELEKYILDILMKHLEQRSMLGYTGYLVNYVKKQFLESVNYTQYGMTGRVIFSEWTPEAMLQGLVGEDEDVLQRIVETIKAFYHDIQTTRIDQVKGVMKMNNVRTKSLTYTFDAPNHKIVVTGGIRVRVQKGRIFEGSVLPCSITLTPRVWMLDASVTSIDVLFVFQPDQSMWMFGGQRRTVLTLKKNEPITLEFVLIPLTTGSLLLPEFTISLYAPSSSLSSSSLSSSTLQNSHLHLLNLTAGTQISVIPRTKSATIRIWESRNLTRQDSDDIPLEYLGNEQVGYSVVGYGGLRREKAISMNHIVL